MTLAKHDIHKFQDTVKLTEENWVDWSDVMKGVLGERGLWGVTNGKELKPVIIAGGTVTGVEVAAWDDKDNAARNQLVRNLSPEIRTKTRKAETSAEVWKTLTAEFESKDPDVVAAVRTAYDNMWFVESPDEGKTMSHHIDLLNEYRDRLELMGDPISDTSHAARLLRNLPEDWEGVAMMIRTVTNKPETVITKLKAEEQVRKNKRLQLEAAAGTIPAASALLAHRFGHSQPVTSTPKSKSGKRHIVCDNCHLKGHDRPSCWAPGGGQEGKAPAWYVEKQKAKQNEKKNKAEPNSGNGKTEPNSGDGKTAATSGAWTAIHAVEAATLAADFSSRWCIDSGATSHVTFNRSWLFDYEEIEPITFHSANKKGVFYAKGRGKAAITLRRPDGSLFYAVLSNVLYAPDIRGSLLSVARFCRTDVKCLFENSGVLLKWRGEIVGKGNLIGNLFWIDAETTIQTLEEPQTNLAMGSGRKADIVTWHHRLAHLNYDTLKLLIRKAVLDGISITKGRDIPVVCEGCAYGKHQRGSFPPSTFEPKEVLEIVYSDLVGPFPQTMAGSKYACTFIDGKSGFARVDFLRDKSADTVLASIDAYQAWAERQTGRKLKTFSSDGGGEYMNDLFLNHVKSDGLTHRTTAPYTPQQNGRAERYNRVLEEAELAMRHSANLGPSFWAESMATACYVRNRIPGARNPEVTPYELFFGVKPNLAPLRTFGCKAYVKIPDQLRRKGEMKSIEGKFMGYYEDSKAYKVWIPSSHKFMKSRDVIFDESGISGPIVAAPNPTPANPAVTTTNPSEGELEIDTQITAPLPPRPLTPLNPLSERPDSDVLPSIPSNLAPAHVVDNGDALYDRVQPWETGSKEWGRGCRVAAALFEGDLTMAEQHACAIVEADEPLNFREAMRSPDRDAWLEASSVEYQQLIDTDTIRLVDLPPGRKAIGCTWVFRVKRDADGNLVKYKARLVAQGFSQIPGVDFHDITAYTPRFASIRTLLALAAEFDLDLRHVDIKGAFLQGDLEEEIYMRQPEGFVKKGEEGKVCKLGKPIYGLRQASNRFQVKLRAWLISLGFKPINADCTLFIMVVNGKVVMIGWHVDDGVIAATKGWMKKILEVLQSGDFEISDLGEPTRCLGCKVERNHELGTIKLSIGHYIDTLINRLNLQNASPVGSPMDPTLHLFKRPLEDGPDLAMANVPYNAAVGSLSWMAETCRPDIVFSRSKFGSFMSNPTLAHFKAVKHTARYLKGTRDLGVTYRKSGGSVAASLKVAADADFANDRDRRSVSGVVVLFNGSPLTWLSRKQTAVSTSTMEAEYYAAMEATREIVWVRRLIGELGVSLKVEKFIGSATTLHLDNQAAMAFIENDTNHNRTKHIDTAYHYVRSKLEDKTITLSHIKGVDNPADLYTKALGPAAHRAALQLNGLFD